MTRDLDQWEELADDAVAGRLQANEDLALHQQQPAPPEIVDCGTHGPFTYTYPGSTECARCLTDYNVDRRRRTDTGYNPDR